MKPHRRMVLTAAFLLSVASALSVGGDEDELRQAVVRGDVGKVKTLLDSGVRPMVAGPMGSVLHAAADRGHAQIAILLINAGAEIEAKNASGRTPLHLAVKSGRRELVDLLVHRGADVNAEDSQECTPLDLASSEDLRSLLIKYGARPGAPPLITAARAGHLDRMKMLLDGGGNADEMDRRGRTLLHLAAANGHRDIAMLLIEKGADVNARDASGACPLHEVAASCTDIAELLIRGGADINAKDSRGLSPLCWALRRRRQDIADVLVRHGARSPLLLIEAAKEGDIAKVREIVDQGENVNAPAEHNYTALHGAAGHGQTEVARYLIMKGADVGAKWCDTLTPLHLAAENGHRPIVEMLLEAGADINAPDDLYLTPLHWAAWNGQTEVVRCLMVP